MTATNSATDPAAYRWKKLSQLTRTKTIATVGPACLRPEVLTELIQAGVDVFRLNMAHGSREQHQQAVREIRAASRRIGFPVAILVDLAGPKIRLGELAVENLQCVPGTQLTFVRGTKAAEPDHLVCSYESLIDEVQVGDWIMLRDGLVRLSVVAKGTDHATCLVVDGGQIRSRQGVNLPGVRLRVPALGPVDRANAKWAASQAIDLISLSFLREASEIAELKRLLAEAGSSALAIAKIEKREALDHLDEIVAASDGVMVARGDLGVEIDVEKTPAAQKRIIRACRAAGKPVIVATQMLESMHDSPQPTRAEVSDVANAILDGADACMLSGETAIGQYPLEAVRMMRKVMCETEKLLEHRRSREVGETGDGAQLESAVIYGAAQIARRIAAKLVVISTSNGRAAAIKSQQRDFIPTVAVTEQAEVLRQMCLFWGIAPAWGRDIQRPESLRRLIDSWAAYDPEIRAGDRVVIVVDSEVLAEHHDIVMVIDVKKPS
jgi:pyruvate kinase